MLLIQQRLILAILHPYAEEQRQRHGPLCTVDFRTIVSIGKYPLALASATIAPDYAVQTTQIYFPPSRFNLFRICFGRHTQAHLVLKASQPQLSKAVHNRKARIYFWAGAACGYYTLTYPNSCFRQSWASARTGSRLIEKCILMNPHVYTVSFLVLILLMGCNIWFVSCFIAS